MKNWRNYLPYLDFWFDISWIQIRTALMREAINYDVFEYIVLKVTIFHKWGFDIRLYSPHHRRLDR